MVVAHPDDETVGVGSRLGRLPGATLVVATDGAPRDRRWWGAPEHATREAYARTRRRELHAALAVAGMRPARVFSLGLVDQEASYRLVELTRRTAAALAALGPAWVLTHPYEGGHPDHDAVAFAVHAACRLLERAGRAAPAVVEFASYHVCAGEIAPLRFLDDDASAVTALLTPDERALKRRMMECYATQRETLRYFPVEVERFRPAPAYDFARPPHAGRLFYENFDWGVTGARWRELARAALAVLDVCGRV